MTENNRENGIAYIFLSLGLVHATALKTLDQVSQKKMLVVVTVLLCAIACFDGYVFNSSVNAARSVHGLSVHEETSEKLPEELKAITWRLPTEYPYSTQRFGEVIEFLKSRPGNFFLFGDSGILYGLTGKYPVNPTLWFHPGLTIPQKNSNAFKNYEQQLLKNIRERNVRYIVAEDFMWNKLSTSDFPELQKFVKENACNSKKIGSFTIKELCF